MITSDREKIMGKVAKWCTCLYTEFKPSLINLLMQVSAACLESAKINLVLATPT